MTTTDMRWALMRPGEIKALYLIVNAKHRPPSALIVSRDETPREEDGGTLFAVPASSKDPRRWNISKGGQIRRAER